MNGNKSLYPIWLGVLGVALLAGAIAGVFIFIQGHVLFNANDVPSSHEGIAGAR